ncbi:O-fucosyltransferase family protein [Bacteroides clarus]|uniref:hypothetical protein n=1 Tax=Bacteroides clarus TaxID=626929 RepID=UPI001899EC59|nr:hypothetical protein [Bacteroides clarus]
MFLDKIKKIRKIKSAKDITNYLWGISVRKTRATWLYPFLYRSYWHYLLHKSSKPNHQSKKSYYAARPNPGAGIGHQLANWIAGYWYAKQLGLTFAHIPFSTPQWDIFLGFGNGEVKVEELKRQGIKIRKLPLFTDGNTIEFALNKAIIQSYANEKVVFIAEQDQFYKAQYGVMEELKQKFHSAPARKNEKLIYNKDHFNIAIHVRRGDIMLDPSNPNLVMRYLSNDYFEKVLKQVTENLQANKPIHIYFFSQGKPEDYPEFAQYPNLHWCLDMNAQESFLHFAYADLLITSKSSFSYKPALLNNGIKVCPKNFWHGYPTSKDWILVENDGTIDLNEKSKFI